MVVSSQWVPAWKTCLAAAMAGRALGQPILEPRSAIGTDAPTLAIHVRLSSVVWEAQQRADVGEEEHFGQGRTRMVSYSDTGINS